MDRSIEEWCSYKYAAGRFHTKKLCSRLFSTEVEFYCKKQQTRVLCHPLGDLGVTGNVPPHRLWTTNCPWISGGHWRRSDLSEWRYLCQRSSTLDGTYVLWKSQTVLVRLWYCYYLFTVYAVLICMCSSPRVLWYRLLCYVLWGPDIDLLCRPNS